MRRNTTASSLVPLFPQANWRGLYETGTKDDGSVVTNSINWPGASASAYLGATPPSSPYEWFGSLITEHADASGLMYRRNRYYDPQKGRFTTPDPIGIAGGLNAYGFAGGDPVSYSDPFGLCPPGGSGFALVYCLLGLDAKIPYTASPPANRGVYVGVSGRVGTERTTLSVGAGKEPLSRSVCLTCITPASGSAFVGLKLRDKSPDEAGMSVSVGPVGIDNEGVQVGPSTVDGCPAETCIEVERTNAQPVATRIELRTLPDNTRAATAGPPPNRVVQASFRP
jgi:RHS repeat-associated protein